MVIEQEQALHFIDRYQTLLGYAALAGGLLKKSDGDGMAMMQKARNAIVQDPSLITKAVAAMEKAGEPWSDDMQSAIASLRVGHWVYLRDTSGYSVFLETGDLQAGYAVKGLTMPLKEYMGDSGALVEAGLLVYQGQIVCDELINLGAWLGRDHKRDFNLMLTEFRKLGMFYRDQLLAAPKKRGTGRKSAQNTD